MCAVCVDKGEVDAPTFNHNRELLGHVASKHLEERYRCLRCQKPTDRAHMSEYTDPRNHPCFKNSQPYWVEEVKSAYTVPGVIALLRWHFPTLPDDAL